MSRKAGHTENNRTYVSIRQTQICYIDERKNVQIHARFFMHYTQKENEQKFMIELCQSCLW